MQDGRVDTILDGMSLEEQVALLSGADYWSVSPPSRLGLGRLRVTDGPNGARGGGSLVGGVSAAAFPVGIALGATWDPALMYDIGTAIATEVRSKAAHVLLGPTVNIQRSVTNGRNFECYSEDPALSAALCVGFVNGLQDEGVGATVKHFAGNESEFERTTISSEIDARSMREVYLRPFEDAVRKAQAWAIMTAYNKVGGTYAAENEHLLTDILRGDWGFDGVVMSDWFGSRSTAPTVNAGLDLEMPGPTKHRGTRLVDAVAAGELSEQTVRERAHAVLRLMARTGALDDTGPAEERAEDRPEHRALIRRAGSGGIVLLKNDGLLPLAATEARPRRIAVIGPNARVATIMGGGSSQLNPHYAVSPWEGLAEKFGRDRLVFAQGCTNHRWEPLIESEVSVDFYDNEELSGAPIWQDTLPGTVAYWTENVAGGRVDETRFSARVRTRFTPPQTGVYRFGLHAAGHARLRVDGALVVDAWEHWRKGRTFFEEGSDETTGDRSLRAGKPVDVEMEFRTKPNDNLQMAGFRFGVSKPLGTESIDEAARCAAEADVALVFVGRNGEWDTEGSDLEGIALPGAQDALVSAVRVANPKTVVVLQTGGPVEMPWADDVPAILQAWYPGQECGNAIADVLCGDTDPGGRLPQSFPRRMRDNPTHSDDPSVYPGKNGVVRYDEGVFVGHRHYDAKGIKPLFPFGHGLSYTSFELGQPRVTRADERIEVSVTLENTGSRAGSSVVQLYVAPPKCPVPRPPRELKAFHKIALAPGARDEVTLSLSLRDFSWFDTEAGCWRITAGSYGLWLGFSATDLRSEATVELEAATLPRNAPA